VFTSAIAPKATTWSLPNWPKSWKLKATKYYKTSKSGGYP
jgi:hypothetical protein